MIIHRRTRTIDFFLFSDDGQLIAHHQVKRVIEVPLKEGVGDEIQSSKD